MALNPLIGGKRRSWSKFTSHYTWGTKRSMWMQDGCKVYMDSYMASNGPRFMVTWTILKTLVLGVRPHTKPGKPWHSECSCPLIYSILSCATTRMNRNSSKQQLVEGPSTYDFTLHLRVRDHTPWFWRCVGTTAFGHFLFRALTISWSWLLACEVWSGP